MPELVGVFVVVFVVVLGVELVAAVAAAGPAPAFAVRAAAAAVAVVAWGLAEVEKAEGFAEKSALEVAAAERFGWFVNWVVVVAVVVIGVVVVVIGVVVVGEVVVFEKFVVAAVVAAIVAVAVAAAPFAPLNIATAAQSGRAVARAYHSRHRSSRRTGAGTLACCPPRGARGSLRRRGQAPHFRPYPLP